MSGMRRVSACSVAVALALGPSASADAAAPPSRMVEKINQVRERHGLHALRYSPSLGVSSSRYARHLIATDRFAHASRISASPRFSRVGEVLSLVSGWRSGMSATVRGWLRSATHRAVILNRRFGHVGVGAARGKFRGRRATIWVAQVGAD